MHVRRISWAFSLPCTSITIAKYNNKAHQTYAAYGILAPCTLCRHAYAPMSKGTLKSTHGLVATHELGDLGHV
jgi:hypothetical protein